MSLASETSLNMAYMAAPIERRKRRKVHPIIQVDVVL